MDLTTKFKRWKAEICWYEGPKSSEAAVYTDSPEVYEQLEKVISSTYRYSRITLESPDGLPPVADSDVSVLLLPT